jgi:hypothetical protein
MELVADGPNQARERVENRHMPAGARDPDDSVTSVAVARCSAGAAG